MIKMTRSPPVPLRATLNRSQRHPVPLVPSNAPTLAQTVRAWHDAGRSQRAIARELSIDRRKVKQIIERAA
jgi:hypothetical protein